MISEPHIPLLAGEAKEESPALEAAHLRPEAEAAPASEGETSQGPQPGPRHPADPGAIQPVASSGSEASNLSSPRARISTDSRELGDEGPRSSVKSIHPLSTVVQNLKCLVTFSARPGRGRAVAARTTLHMPPFWASIGSDSPGFCPLLGHDSLHRHTDLLRTTFASAPISCARAQRC